MPTTPPLELLVIGALHVDEIAQLSGTTTLGESHPVSWTRRVGGVAANTSRAAANNRPDLNVQLIANCNSDQLHAAMSHSAVNVIPINTPKQPTGRYSAVLQSNGDVLIGLADTAQAEQLTYDLISEKIDFHSVTAVTLDGNLSAHAMQTITTRLPKQCQSFGISVSPAKAQRFNTCLPALDLVFCNVTEACAMARHMGHSKTTTNKPAELLSHLCNTGCMHVVMTAGADGVYIGSGTELSHVPVLASNHPTTLNGPGDALAGATIAHLVGHALTHNKVVDAISQFGIPAANAVLTGNNQAPLLDEPIC